MRIGAEIIFGVEKTGILLKRQTLEVERLCHGEEGSPWREEKRFQDWLTLKPVMTMAGDSPRVSAWFSSVVTVRCSPGMSVT